MSHPIMIQRALISVSDKTNIIPFAQALFSMGVEIISTGGTCALLRQHNIKVTEISDYTGFPEIMGGRVKTLHPKVHGGILGRRDTDADIMIDHHIDDIDLVIVNLYPFEDTIKDKNCTLHRAIENIDIGGPTLLRAAAKNYEWVSAVVDPKDYQIILDDMKQLEGAVSGETRFKLAVKVFAHTAYYEKTIADYLHKFNEPETSSPFPAQLNIELNLADTLRYGENPQQRAALYLEKPIVPHTLATAEFKQGKALSFNNLADGDAALECVKQFNEPACVIVKHANPCGIGLGVDLNEAYQKAYQCDPESSFGGIIAFNNIVDDTLMQTILNQQFVEVIIAPTFSQAALNVAKHKTNLRLLEVGLWDNQLQEQSFDMKRIKGGLLIQDFDNFPLAENDYQIVSQHKPSSYELKDLVFALKAVKFVKSNGIVIAKSGQTLGIGAGQMSRVFALKIAHERAKASSFSIEEAVLASDAFFPFRDSIDIAAQMGIKAIIQPSGSKRDNEIICAANEHKIALIFVPHRYFKH